MKIKFNEEEDNVFEYPSESYLLKTYDCHSEELNNDIQNGFKLEDSDDVSKDDCVTRERRTKNLKIASVPASSLNGKFDKIWQSVERLFYYNGSNSSNRASYITLLII